jgi:hypothetical protein
MMLPFVLSPKALSDNGFRDGRWARCRTTAI